MHALLRMTDSEMMETLRCHAEILLGYAPPDSSEHWAEWQGDQLEAERRQAREKQRAKRARRRQRVSATTVSPGDTPGTPRGRRADTTITNVQNSSSLSDPVSLPSKLLSQDPQHVTQGKGQQSLDVGNVNGVEYVLGLWKDREPWSLLTQDEQAQKARDLTDDLDQDIIRRVTNQLSDFWCSQSSQARTGAKRTKTATQRWISGKWRRNVPWAKEQQAKERAAEKAGVAGKAQSSEDGAREIPTVDHSKYYYPGEDPGT